MEIFGRIKKKIRKKEGYNFGFFSFMIAPCLCELDVSIIDRLSPVFNGSPFTVKTDNSTNESSVQQDIQTNTLTLTLESSSIDIRLR